MGKIQNMRQYYDIKASLEFIKTTARNPLISKYAKQLLNDLDIILNINLGRDNYLVMKDSINVRLNHMWGKHKVYDGDPEVEDQVNEEFILLRSSLDTIFGYYDEVHHYDNTII